MKKVILLTFVVVAVILPFKINAQVSSQDELIVRGQVENLAAAINNSDMQSILELMSPDADPSIYQQFVDNLSGKSIVLEHSITSIEQLPSNDLKVKIIFSASSKDASQNWEATGASAYITFTKVGNDWLITDTDLAGKLSSNYVFGVILKILAIITPIMLILTVFWFWMLIDVLRKPDMPNQSTWIIIILLLQLLGAIAYFFGPRRQHKKAHAQRSQGKAVDVTHTPAKDTPSSKDKEQEKN